MDNGEVERGGEWRGEWRRRAHAIESTCSAQLRGAGNNGGGVRVPARVIMCMRVCNVQTHLHTERERRVRTRRVRLDVCVWCVCQQKLRVGRLAGGLRVHVDSCRALGRARARELGALILRSDRAACGCVREETSRVCLI